MAKDENLYAQAMAEYEAGEIDENLKVKAHVLANGDIALEKFEYVRLRVERIKEQKLKSLPNRIGTGVAAAAEAMSAERASKAAERKEQKPNVVLMVAVGIVLVFLLMLVQAT